MTCSIEAEDKQGYLRIVVTGDNTAETLRSYTQAVPQLCAQHAQWRVLVVVRLDGPDLPMLDVYQRVSSSSDETAHLGMRIAWVDETPGRRVDTMRLAENVARSRGIAVRTFRNETDATQWLVSDALDD